MKKISFRIAIFISLSTSVFAQNKTYIGFDFGYKGDIYQFADYGNSLTAYPIPGSVYGFNLGQELKNSIIVESGIYKVNYWSSVMFKELSFGSSGSSIDSWQIPFRLKTNINLYKNKISISPYIGYVLAFNQNYTSSRPNNASLGYGSATITNSTDSISYYYDEFSNYKKVFSLIETGIALNYKTKHGFQWSIITNYNTGLSKVIQQNVKYTINNQPEQKGNYVSNGDNFQVLIGLKYQISNIWQNKNERENNKKEKLSAINNSGKQKFYIGTDIGLSRNKFDNTNQNIYAFEKTPNIFWNNDIIIGLKIGYKATEKISIETGYYSLFFTNSYTIKYYNSYSEGGKIRTGGTGFVQVPLRFKYNYYLLNNRLAIVPYVGAAIFTHYLGVGKYDTSIFETRASNELSSSINDTTTIVLTAYREKNLNVLFVAGIGVEYFLTKKLIFTLYGNSSTGFKEINRLNLVYDKNTVLHQEGDIGYKGTSFNITCGLKMNIGKYE
ncbi:MAG: hypothetical protein GXO79_03365 [Chlorobi bacterium]|nr:hypothetical protein [Chlorobiota bacterium]